MKEADLSAIVLFAHGARDPEWAAPMRRIQQRLRAIAHGAAVELAFLESMQPTLAQAVQTLQSRGVARLTLIPLFLAQGGHLKSDLPRLVKELRQKHPAIEIRVTSAIGDSEVLTNAIAEWALAQHGTA